jgi:hypothetical protein
MYAMFEQESLKQEDRLEELTCKCESNIKIDLKERR